MKEYIQKLTLSDYLFFVALVLWMSAFFCYERTFLAVYIERYIWSIDFLTMTLLFASEIIRPKRNLWCLAGLVAVAFCSFAALRAGTNNIVIILFFIFVSRDTDFRISAFVSLVTMITLTVSITGLSLLGVLPDPVFTGSRVRHCLGFRYPLYPAQCIFMIVCLWSYLRGTKITVAEIVFLFICNYAFYIATDSRLSFFLTTGLLLLLLIIKLFSYTKLYARIRSLFYTCVPIGVILSGCFIICASISIATTAAYDPSNANIQQLDNLLGGRLRYGYQGLNDYGIPWGGQIIPTNGNGLAPDGSSYVTSETYFYIDCLYVLILVRYGFVFFAIFIGAFTIACWYAWKQKQGFMLLALIFIALHCVIDDLSFYLFFDPFLLLLGVALSWLCKRQQSNQVTAAFEQ